MAVGARFIASGKVIDNLPLHPLRRGIRRDMRPLRRRRQGI
jgi:hypothetical protein